MNNRYLWPVFNFKLNQKGNELSRARLKILQLELWLEPAWLDSSLVPTYLVFSVL